MAYVFRKHYTREEARALLPQIREWLQTIGHLRAQFDKYDRRLRGLIKPGVDSGGRLVNDWTRAKAELSLTQFEFDKREIVVKDLDRGLIDFPAILAGNEVFLCWEKGEEDIEFWHDLDSGYAGRERL